MILILFHILYFFSLLFNRKYLSNWLYYFYHQMADISVIVHFFSIYFFFYILCNCPFLLYILPSFTFHTVNLISWVFFFLPFLSFPNSLSAKFFLLCILFFYILFVFSSLFFLLHSLIFINSYRYHLIVFFTSFL